MAVLRRRVACLAFLVLVALSTAFAQAEKVYVTKTGSKYHRASCSSLSKSKIEMPLAEAAKRYGPCKNCKPPVPAATSAGTAAATASPGPALPTKSAPAAAGRCQATTKKGTQCSRRAQPGRNYCWQH